MNTLYKKIKNYNGYSCSTIGFIRNDDTGRILNPKPCISGYVTMGLKNNHGINKQIRVHRIIAETWIDNPQNLPTVNHKNKIRHDNRKKNLEWMSHRDQCIHRSKTYKQKKRINNNKGIWQCDKLTGTKIKYFRTIKEASMDVTTNENGYKNISICARGKGKSAYGYSWLYDTNMYDQTDTNEHWKLYKKQKRSNYYASNLGRIRNNDRILKLYIHKTGYYNVTIDKTHTVHRIIAKLFVDNSNNYNVVNHIDGNKLNNDSKNLEWCTIKHNVKEAINIGLRKNVKKVIHYNNDGNILGIYNSCMDASRKLNTHHSSINKCCKGNLKTCGKNNCLFKYLTSTDDIKNKQIDWNTIPKRIKKRRNMGKHIVRKIKVHDKTGKLIEICKSKRAAGRKYNVNTKTIDNHCNKIVKYPKLQYIFSYA